MNDYVLLYSHCVIVKGVERSTICDLQRQAFYFIPGTFAELFLNKRYFNKRGVSNSLEKDEKLILEEYISFLEQNELAFCCDEDEIRNFPKMKSELLVPATISHCILDTDLTLDYFTESFIKHLGELCCDHIQVRFFGKVSIEGLKNILNLIRHSYIKSIEIFLNVQDRPDLEQSVIALTENNPKIYRVVFFAAQANKIIKEGFGEMGAILSIEQKISSSLHCGIIDSRFFSVNIPTYMESLSYNSCLNKKISIDIDGNIKNCPSMKESFGNIKDTTLQEAINKPGFKKYWNIKKDEITKCKDCEFRHVCTDCRAFLENPADIYSAPLKCGYNPYTCEWEEWSINPLKQLAIEHYKMQEIVGK